MKITTSSIELTGSSYEIGAKLGKRAALIPTLKANLTSGFEGFGDPEMEAAVKLFEQWCPGLNEELMGFAHELQVPIKQVIYYGMTYLRPSCSHIALLPSMTECGRPLLARNYEFCHEAEDFTLMKTSVAGKYKHLGTSVLQFGRDDGLNECGLAVTMSSCGFPVGPLPYMRKPKLTGLQFWAVIRSLLENCRDVQDGLELLKEMPIAYNMNLILADKQGTMCLFETLDGRKAVKTITRLSREQALYATNHPILPELIPFEPKAMAHSLVRYQWIEKQLEQVSGITKETLKEMLLSRYPQGLCCHCFKDYFGTTKSMILDPVNGSMELCWGGRAENGFIEYQMDAVFEEKVTEIEIEFDHFRPEMGEYIPLNGPKR